MELCVTSRQRQMLAPVFDGWQETMLWSALEGAHGTAAADRLPGPAAGRIQVGDFCFFAGDPAAAGSRELAETARPAGSRTFFLAIARDPSWNHLLESVWGGKAKKTLRYATEKDPSVFDRAYLTRLREEIPAGFQLKRIDRECYEQTLKHSWAADLCAQFSSWEDYARRGRGFAAEREGELVCGASSYTVWSGGLEIEIDTREDCRRMGLATACAAALILDCLDRKKVPSWDAANPESLALAKKLGYRPAGSYETYLVTMERENTMEQKQAQLRKIAAKFVASGWELIAGPAKEFLEAGEAPDTAVLRTFARATEQANQECGSCGCALDPLYKQALNLLGERV